MKFQEETNNLKRDVVQDTYWKLREKKEEIKEIFRLKK